MDRERLLKGWGHFLFGAAVGGIVLMGIHVLKQDPVEIKGVDPLPQVRNHSSSHAFQVSDFEPTIPPAATDSSTEISDVPQPAPVQAVTPLSEDMQRWATAVEAGQQVTVSLLNEDREFLFRPVNVTSDQFRISTGAEGQHAVEYRVYEGRELTGGELGDGKAALAIVDDTFSVALTTEQGDFLIEEDPETGEMMAVVLG